MCLVENETIRIGNLSIKTNRTEVLTVGTFEMSSRFFDRILNLPDHSRLERVAVIQHIIDLHISKIGLLEQFWQFLFDRLFAGHRKDRHSQVASMLYDRTEREQMPFVVRDFRVLSSAADDLGGRFVTKATTKTGRNSRRSADVRRQTQHRGGRSDQRRTASSRAARNSAQIVRIVGSSSYIIMGIKPKMIIWLVGGRL